MSTATTAVFLYIGLDNERRNQPGKSWPDIDHISGFTGLVDLCESMATVIGEWLTEDFVLNNEFPGVFDYEVTEAMGVWLFHNLKATPDEFKAELVRFVKEWRGKAQQPNQPMPAEQPAASKAPALEVTDPELVYQDELYADIAMYISLPGGVWRLAHVREFSTNAIHEFILFAYPLAPFEKTDKAMPAEVRALFDSRIPEVKNILLALVHGVSKNEGVHDLGTVTYLKSKSAVL